MHNFCASLIELTAVIKDQLDVSAESLLVTVCVPSHLCHYRRNIHRFRHHAAVLFIHLFIAHGFWRYRVKEVSNLVVIVKLPKNEPALLHVGVCERLSCERIVLLLIIAVLSITILPLLLAILVVFLVFLHVLIFVILQEGGILVLESAFLISFYVLIAELVIIIIIIA
jgi:hypothetical protein